MNVLQRTPPSCHRLLFPNNAPQLQYRPPTPRHALAIQQHALPASPLCTHEKQSRSLTGSHATARLQPPRATAADDEVWVDGDGEPIPPEERELYGQGPPPTRPGSVDAVIEELVAQIEGAMRCMVDDDAMRITPPEQVFRIMDSLDPLQEEHEGMSYPLPDPPRGDAAYPRMMIENRCYSTRVFRKIHFEVAWQQDGLQVLHIVMYPRAQFDFPIFGLDVVGTGGNRYSLAVLDLCPVAPDRSLPPTFAGALKRLQETYGLVNNREIPEWGQRIFSPWCVLVRPTSPDDMASFIKYAIAVARLTYELSLLARPVPSNEARRLKQIGEGHQRFCEAQRSNRKTSAVLEKAFGVELAQRYLREVMFDHEHANSEAAAAVASD